MSYDLVIRDAVLEDVDAVIEIAKLSFEKYDGKKYGMSFDPLSVDFLYKNTIKSETQKLFVATNNNVVVGAIHAVITPTLFDYNKTIITEIGMQSNPILTKIKQTKIILSLINFLEIYAKKHSIDLISFNITPDFDISGKLIKKQYKLIDKVLSKEVN